VLASRAISDVLAEVWLVRWNAHHASDRFLFTPTCIGVDWWGWMLIGSENKLNGTQAVALLALHRPLCIIFARYLLQLGSICRTPRGRDDARRSAVFWKPDPARKEIFAGRNRYVLLGLVPKFYYSVPPSATEILLSGPAAEIFSSLLFWNGLCNFVPVH
jgi:hypothetical protein